LADFFTELETSIFDSETPFESKFESVFKFQYSKNSYYRTFLNALGYSEKDRFTFNSVPLLPVRAFKSALILADDYTESLQFRSSGTSAMARSRHGIVNPELYKTAISTEFYSHFPKDDVIILAFLPKYDENPDSSLIWMVQFLVNNDPSGLSGFIHSQSDISKKWLDDIKASKKKVLVFGAAFGLVDIMNEPNPLESLELEVIETGGMKTHKREMSKNVLRNKISEYFKIPLTSVHSEYGMCELHSQMYAIGSEWFSTPPWVKISIRNAENPEKACKPGETGLIGVIDLANLYSCPFILTKDRGVMNNEGQFQVLGRWDKDNMRGCNFLIDAEI
jgi:hypothetical protein